MSTDSAKSSAVPLLGIALVATGLLVVPWSKGVWLATIFEQGQVGFAVFYVRWLAYPSLLFGALLTLAAFHNSAWLKRLHLLIWAGAVSFAVLVALAILFIPAFGGEAYGAWGPVAAAGVLLCCAIAVAIAFGWWRFNTLDERATRIVACLILLGFALVSGMGVYSVYTDIGFNDDLPTGVGPLYTHPWPTAYLTTCGWIVCALSMLAQLRTRSDI